jgi:hypothetical protein
MIETIGPGPLAVGWATVDLDRAAVELAPWLAPGSAFDPAADCELLGARCRIGQAREAVAPAPLVVLLEPSTEGRLAATLARHAEGWCATWEADRAGARRTSVVMAGPLGPERLVLDGPVHGPHRLLVRPATIGS